MEELLQVFFAYLYHYFLSELQFHNFPNGNPKNLTLCIGWLHQVLLKWIEDDGIFLHFDVLDGEDDAYVFFSPNFLQK
jgi:hypothetical protein